MFVTLTFTSSVFVQAQNSVTLDISKGYIDIYPDGYTQGNNAKVNFTGDYIITGSSSGSDTPLEFHNTSGATARFNVTFKNLNISARIQATAIRFKGSNFIFLTVNSYGDVSIKSGGNHAAFFSENTHGVDLSIFHECGTLSITGSHNNHIAQSDAAGFGYHINIDVPQNTVPYTATINHTNNYKADASQSKFTQNCIYCDKTAHATLSAYDVTYNGATQETAEITYSDNWEGALVELSYSDDTKNVGTVTTTATISNASITTSYKIKPAKLTIKADDKSIVYGEEVGEYSVTLNGIMQGDENCFVSENIKAASSYKQYDDCGEYEIVPTGFNSQNYIIEYQKGTLTVQPKEVELVWGETVFTYDGTEKLPTATAKNTLTDDIISLTVIGEETEIGNGYIATVTEIKGEKAHNYTLPNNHTTEFSIIPPPGDVNGDGKVSIIDVTTIQRSIAKIYTLTDEEAIRADVSQDGEITIFDATYIQQIIAKIK